jgi:rubrerythrin
MLSRFVYKNFWSRLAATPQGRRHIYSFALAAEEGDEHGVFDLLAENVAAAEHKKLIRVHQADEERHAGLFRECLERMGQTAEEIPHEMRIIRRMGSAFTAENDSGRVVELYAMLRAIEVRGVEQFPIIAEALRPHDAFGADTFLQVAQDEKRHVGFCDIVGGKEAASPGAWREKVAHYAAMERRAFLTHGLVSLRHAIRGELMVTSPVERYAESVVSLAENALRKLGILAIMPQPSSG